MVADDELFQLIKSLTPSEKRYFRIHASKHVIGKSNHYEKLFDALDVLPDDKPYDEAAFKKSLRGKSYGKHLSDEKSHLREMILRAMRSYHAEHSPKGQLVEMIHDISFLYSKGFVKSCHHQIEKASKLAEDSEQHTEMLVLNDFLIKLYAKDPAQSPLSITELEYKEKDILDKILIGRQAVLLGLKIIDIRIRSQWKEREAEAKVYFDTATRLAAKDGLSPMTLIVLLNVQQQYLHHHHKYAESLDITLQWLEKIEKDENVFDYMIEMYQLVLGNYMMSAMHCERFDLIPTAIEKLKLYKLNNEKEEADRYRLSTQYELIYLLNSDDLSQSAGMLQQIEQGLKKYKRFIPEDQAVTFRFNVALLHFLKKEYTEALRQINALYDLSGREKRYDYTTTLARAMEWMCQSATGNHDILDSSLRNLRRHMEERRIKHEFFDHMYALFDAIIRNGNKKPASLPAFKSNISASTPPTQWEQLKAIVLAWA